MEGDVVQMQEIFKFVRTGTAADGTRAGPLRRHRRAAALSRRAGAPRHQDSRQPISTPASRCKRHAFDINPVYLFYLLVGVGGGAVRRGRLSAVLQQAVVPQEHQSPSQADGHQPDRESVLVQLRRERGLTATGDYRLPLIALNRLILQSGLKLGIVKFAIYRRRAGAVRLRPASWLRRASDLLQRSAPRCSAASLLPLLVLKFKRSRRQKKFGAQFPDALDIIVRSLARRPSGADRDQHGRRAKWPIRSAPSSASSPTKSPMAPISKPAMRNLYFRIGQDDLPLFVTAVAIQGSTGGNLGEILENLSRVIRERFKMRRKIKRSPPKAAPRR